MPKTYAISLFSISALFVVACVSSSKLSPCLETCLEPMARIEKTIANMYRNYENVCEKLEKSAFCAQKCGPEDQSIFLQYSTFYRIHCVEFEEALEEELPCLREASYKADIYCREKCLAKSDKGLNKLEKQINLCKNVECATICYFKEFAKKCPDSPNVLLQINVRIANDMTHHLYPSEVEKMPEQCKRIHDGEYIKHRLLHELGY